MVGKIIRGVKMVGKMIRGVKAKTKTGKMGAF
jgi:hypothetical protein